MPQTEPFMLEKKPSRNLKNRAQKQSVWGDLDL